MKNPLIYIVLLSLAIITFVGFNSSHDDNNLHQEMSSNFDTSKVCQLLHITKEDSLRLHLNPNIDSLYYWHYEFISLDTIYSELEPFYIRTIISRFRDNYNYPDLSSFIMLYKSKEDNSNLHRISADSLELEYGGRDTIFPNQRIIDVNYDGYNDIVISFGFTSAGSSFSNYFFLFNSTTLQFEKSNSLDSMFQDKPIFISENSKEITIGNHSGPLGAYGYDYKWDGSKYVLYAEYKSELLGKYFISTRKEFVNGKWIVVECDTTIYE